MLKWMNLIVDLKKIHIPEMIYCIAKFFTSLKKINEVYSAVNLQKIFTYTSYQI